MTGTRYYLSNEEIGYPDSKIIRLYDENDNLIGDLTLKEAKDIAELASKDVVMRNDKLDPPVCKIMNYKLELMRRIYKKLG